MFIWMREKDGGSVETVPSKASYTKKKGKLGCLPVRGQSSRFCRDENRKKNMQFFHPMTSLSSQQLKISVLAVVESPHKTP